MFLRLRHRYTQVKSGKIPRVIRKLSIDHLKYCASDFIHGHFGSGRHLVFGAPALTVGRVIVPLPTFGRAIRIQQHSVFATHLAIEVFHAQLLAVPLPL